MNQITVLLIFIGVKTAVCNKDPFEYFKKLTRDVLSQSQCDRVPPFQLQLDPSFFDADLQNWQPKKNPPPSHRTLEGFIKLDTLRQSTYFSQILQSDSQAAIPGILYFYLSAAAQLHALKQLSVLSGKNSETVQTVRYAFESNEVLRVPWYKVGGSFVHLQRPLGIYAYSNEAPEHVSIVDIGVGPSSTNDYTVRFYEHFNQFFNTPPKMFRNYDEYFQALIQSWLTRLRPDLDDVADWDHETREFQNLHRKAEYFPLPFRSIPKPQRTDVTERLSDFNPVFPYADLVYEYHRDPNFYRHSKSWFLNQTQAESNQYSFTYPILPDRIQRHFLFPMLDEIRWTGPYIFCPYNPTEWLVASIQPIWAKNYFDSKKNPAIPQTNRRFNYAGVTNVELNYRHLDVNQCPGERRRNFYSNTAVCDRNSYCEPLPNIGFQSGGYQCSCHSTYRYPSVVRTPYRPSIDAYPTLQKVICQPIRLINEYPTWQASSQRSARSLPRPNLFEKFRSLIFNRPSTCPPWSHIAILPIEQNTDDNIRFVQEITQYVDRVARPFTLQAVRLAHLFSSYLALYRPDRDPANDGFIDRRPDPVLTEQWIESEILSTGLAYHELLEVGVYLNGSEYERQNPFQQQGQTLHSQTEFGYRTSVYRPMNYGLSFIRFDTEEEKYLINRTLDGNYLQHGSWYDKAMNSRHNVEVRRYSVSMNMRRDLLGTQLVKLPTYFYDAPVTGIWFGPYHDCSFLNPSPKSMVRWRYSVPIIKEASRLPIGFVSIVFGSNLRWYSINPCDDSIGLNQYNPFQGIHKCHRQTTECQYQPIPDEESGYDLASYRCVCKPGYEYPFGSMKNYFQGAIVEREYAKMSRGEFNAYENMQCRPINPDLDSKQFSSKVEKYRVSFLSFVICFSVHLLFD